MSRYLRKNKFVILSFTLFVFLAEGLKLMIARLNGTLVDTATAGGRDALFSLFLLIVLLSVAMPVCFYLYSFFSEYFRVRIQREMRKDLFGNILNHSYKEYLKREEGAYIASYTTQIKSLDDSYFFSIYGILQIIADLVLALVFLYFIYPPFVIYSIIATIPAILLPNLLKPMIGRLQEESLKRISDNIAALNEYFDGLDTILFFRRRNQFQKIFFAQNEEVRKIKSKIPVYMQLSVNLSRLILELYTIVIIFLATMEISRGNISIGTYIAAIHIIGDFTGGLAFATHYIQQFSVAKKTLEHIFSFMEDTPHGDKDQNASVDLMSVDNIAFENVDFSYGEKALIQDMTYRFKQKGIYQIVGASGSGKTTLMNLLCNYVTAQSGATKINDHPVAEICNLDSLFTIMRQEAIFFDGTLRDNITMFADHPEETVVSGLVELGIPYIKDKLDDTEINLSGGEARRVMLLRALLRDSDILILDEPLANLDKESIGFVENRLKQIEDKFVFVITHEALSIPVVDTILVGSK